MSDRKFYYVSCIASGLRKAFLAGPYADHQSALDAVEKVRDMAVEVDSWACFYAFGTARSDQEIKTRFGEVSA